MPARRAKTCSNKYWLGHSTSLQTGISLVCDGMLWMDSASFRPPIWDDTTEYGGIEWMFNRFCMNTYFSSVHVKIYIIHNLL